MCSKTLLIKCVAKEHQKYMVKMRNKKGGKKLKRSTRRRKEGVWGQTKDI